MKRVRFKIDKNRKNEISIWDYKTEFFYHYGSWLIGSGSYRKKLFDTSNLDINNMQEITLEVNDEDIS